MYSPTKLWSSTPAYLSSRVPPHPSFLRSSHTNQLLVLLTPGLCTCCSLCMDCTSCPSSIKLTPTPPVAFYSIITSQGSPP